MKEFIGIIPARYASSRLPGKPLADICGKSMIRRVYERVSLILPHLIVATDDQRIMDEINSFNGKAIMTSVEHNSGTDRCNEAADIYISSLAKFKPEADYVIINIQGDEPLIHHEQIQLLMHCFDDPSTEIATIVKKIDDQETLFNPNNPKVLINDNSEAIYFSRATIPYLRNFPAEVWLQNHTFYKHIGMYAYRFDILKKIAKMPGSILEKAESLEQLRWIENGIRIKVAKTEMETISIDTPEDLEKVRKIIVN